MAYRRSGLVALQPRQQLKLRRLDKPFTFHLRKPNGSNLALSTP